MLFLQSLTFLTGNGIRTSHSTHLNTHPGYTQVQMPDHRTVDSFFYDRGIVGQQRNTVAGKNDINFDTVIIIRFRVASIACKEFRGTSPALAP